MKKIIIFLVVLFSFLVSSVSFASDAKLKWNGVANVDKYIIYIQEEGVPVRSVDIPNSPNVYFLTDLGLKVQTNYVFWITASNINGESAESNYVSYYSSVPEAPVLELVEE
jgi:hypothetical protein